MTSLLTAFVPPALHGTTFEEETVVNGNRVEKKYYQRLHNGHHVIDISLAFYNRLLNGPNGLEFERANPEIKEWLGGGDRREMYCNAFPGEHRPPPTAPIEVELKMVRLRAPAGASSYSHGGVEHAIDKNGTITVDEHVADILRSHGFLAA